MNRLVNILLGVVAVASGLAIAYSYYANYSRNIEVQQLPVPMNDIAPYSLLTADMFQMKEFPRALVTGYATDTAALAGRVSLSILPAGYPVPVRMAADSNSFRVAPPGKTMISIPVTPSIAVGGELAPGMKVDIYRLVPPAQTNSVTGSAAKDGDASPQPIVQKIASGVTVKTIYGDQGLAGKANASASNGPLGASSASSDAPARILVLVLMPSEAEAVLSLMAETKRDALLWIALTPLAGGG
jgi:Flp pilus assembly protein CpaB